MCFFAELLQTGRVTVSSGGPPSLEDLGDLEAVLRDADSLARLELAFAPPALDMPAAAWAATLLYEASWLLVHREADADAVRAAFARPCPSAPSASVCYSVDLAFRYVPDLAALARGFAPGDPLVSALGALAATWPLSSVGMEGVGSVDPSWFVDDPSLRMLYIDRIIERKDFGRGRQPAVREALRVALGIHGELVPGLGTALEKGDAP